MNKKLVLACSASAAIAAVSLGAVSPANAQQADEARVETDSEIIVTANKREENIQDVPITITTFTGDQLQELGFRNGYDLVQQTPGFVISQFGRNHPISYTTIRGIGGTDSNPFNDPSVSYYVDEVYQAASFAGNAQIYDLERAEVLKGPQGTLFGRNATGGLVHFITQQPTEEFEGYARGRMARFGERVIEGAVGGGIAPGIRARVAAQYSANDGIDENPATGEDDFGRNETIAARATFDFDLAQNLELRVSGHGYDSVGERRAVRFFGHRDPLTGNMCTDEQIIAVDYCTGAAGTVFPSPDNTTTTYPYRPPSLNGQAHGGYARLTWDAGWAEIVSLSSYEKARSHLFADCYGGTGVALLEYCAERDARRESYSQEIRASGSPDWGNWVVGVYYFHDVAGQTGRSTRVPFDLATQFSFASSLATTESSAAFAQVDYNLTDDITIIGGLRYTHDDRNFEYNYVPDTANLSGGHLTGKVVLQWEPTDNLMTFLQYSHGYKSGGFGAAPTNNVAQEETVDAYEFGVKSNWANGRLQLNTSFFLYDFQGLQIQAQDLNRDVDPPVPVTGFVNLDQIDIYGLDIDLTMRPTDNLSITLGAEYLQTQINDRDLIVDRVAVNGNDAPNAPAWAATGVIRYDIPTETFGTYTLQSDFRWTDTYYTSASNRLTHRVDAFAVANFRLLWEDADGRVNAGVFLENAFDEVYPIAIFSSPTRASGNIPFWSQGFWDVGMPRVWGAEIRYSF